MAIPNPSSAFPGYLVPDTAPAPVPLYGAALEDIFHDTIQGITGLVDGSLIRPRWQPDPPNQPDFGVDWVAFGIMERKGDWNPYQAHDPAANAGWGVNVFERDEELVVLHSFYGPNSAQIQSQYADGLFVDQNRDLLTTNGIKLMSVADAYNVPALLKEKWVKKVDQRVTFRRRIRREYPILHVVGADITLDNEKYLTQIVVTAPIVP